MKKLIFVYNAEDGFINVIMDSLRKIISPKTYPCKLCAITYNNFSMQEEWKNFLRTLPVKKEFLHKSEFIRSYPSLAHLKLPVVLIQDKNIDVLISADDFLKINTITELKTIIEGIL